MVLRGKTFHAPVIRCVPGLALTVVGSTRREAVLADFPDAKVCSAEEVVAHPDVDLVVVATPNDSHLPLAAAAMRAGKDVVVDKPFTVTLAEARELVVIAKQHGRLLSVFQNRRWYSEILATKAILESGVLGEVSHYESHMDRFRPNVRQRWRENPGPGAGLWFDLGPHLIDQALHLFGMPDSVNGNFGILRPGGQTDDWAHVQLNYPKLRVVLNASLLVAWGMGATGGPRSALHGTRASWAKFGPDLQEPQLMAGMLPTDQASASIQTPAFSTMAQPAKRQEFRCRLATSDPTMQASATRSWKESQLRFPASTASPSWPFSKLHLPQETKDERCRFRLPQKNGRIGKRLML
jgi:predicted dehydrogenase